MGKKTTGIAMVLILISFAGFSHRADSIKTHLNHYSLAVGTGWTHYYNNLEYGDQNIKQDFVGISLKFFWEPEYRLSLGLETGYYKLFKVTDHIGTDTVFEAHRTVVPLMLMVRMRLVDNFYLSAGMGLALINNKTSVLSVAHSTQTWSLSNYEFAGSYLYPFSRHLQAGGEVKLYNFGSLNDWMYGIHLTCAYRF